jgi:hypothetical protein
MKKKIILALKIIFSAAILTFILYKIPVKEIAGSVASADFLLIVISFFIYLICNYLSAFETSYLTNVQGMFISTFRILKIHLASMFYNLFLPGLISGGVIKWYKFSKYGSKSDAAAVVAFNRFLEILMLIFTGIIYSLPVLKEGDQKHLIIIWIFLLVLIFAGYFLLLNQKFLNFSEKVILLSPFPKLIKNAVIKIFNSTKRFRELSFKENLQIFGLLFLYHSLGIVSAYLLALSLNIQITLFDIAWIRAAVNIITMLPISFAGLGVREGSIIFLLGNYGIKPDTAMAYSLLMFFNMTLVSLSGGVIEFTNFLKGKRVTADKKVNQ